MAPVVSTAAPLETSRPVFIITGGNRGIGKEIARGLLGTGAHVVLACRDVAACELAREELQAAANLTGGLCECGARLDLEDYGSVRSFASQQKADLQRRGVTLAGLINNAGVMGVAANAETGFDRHLVANHLGPYLLTRLMAPSLGPGSRIINMSSRAHYMGQLSIDGGEIVDSPSHWWWQYGRSKLCNVLTVAELARRLGPRGISSYSVSPGMVNTGIFQNLPPPLCWAAVPARWLFRTPTQGAASAVYAATSPDLVGRSMLFIHDCKEKEPSELAKSSKLATQLWDASAQLVGLSPGPDEPNYI